MRRSRLEAEALFTTMYAGLPLYAAESGARIAVAICHLVLGLLLLRAWFGRRELTVDPSLLKGAAILYLFFLPLDAALLSRSLIAASTNLVFFIAVYQALDPQSRANRGQRLLIALLIFVISVATSTSLSIVFFVIGFVVLTYRQLISLTHTAALADTGSDLVAAPRQSAALTYLLPTIVLAAMFFPMLPRIRNPLVRGMTGSLEGASTGLSDSIDFSVARSISADPAVVARVWMPPEGVAFFTPLRLRGTVYDSWRKGRWVAHGTNTPQAVLRDVTGFVLARPRGLNLKVTVQQNMVREQRLFVPSGTHHISGLNRLSEAGDRTVYFVPGVSRGAVTYEAEMSRLTFPLVYRTPHMPEYPVNERVAALAQRIAGDARTPDAIALRIEQFLSSRYEYVPDPATLGHAYSVNDFLLRERRGHCEYFAAGMVVLLAARGVPGRIVGGFYGGKLNPLTGYFTVQKSDAHAWVEAYDGERWTTYDPTPASLRPGNQKQGLVRVYASALADFANFFWDRYILTFGLGDQIALAMRAIDGARALAHRAVTEAGAVKRRLLSPLGLALLALLLAAATALRAVLHYRKPPFRHAIELLLDHGYAILPSTTPDELLQQVEQRRPEISPPLRVIIDSYYEERFSARPVTAASRRTARAALRELRSL